MAIRLVKERITRAELKELVREDPGLSVKVVADVARGVIGVGGPLHHDIEVSLIADGSIAKDLWGFSLFLDKPWDDAFEFRSHVNVRPLDGNPSIQIHDKTLCDRLVVVAGRRIDWDR